MRGKRREPPRSPESAAANSPTRRRGIDAKDAEPPLPDIATELSSVYFSYSPDPAALAEEDAAIVASSRPSRRWSAPGCRRRATGGGTRRNRPS